MAGILESTRWEVLAPRPEVERAIAERFGLTPLAARVLAARGHADVEEVGRFLAPSLERDWQDPLAVPGLGAVADRVEQAIREGESIVVFGDFDVDGMTSTALLTRALRELGAQVRALIPRRFEEGYGLSPEAVERLMAEGAPGLVVTVDNGVASGAEVAALLARGVDVAVTDHHEPGDSVPQGVPVADPKLDPACPSRDLAGAGVALKLVQELGRRLGRPDLWRSYLALAALGTVSDMMELTAENRALVAAGVSQMRGCPSPGLQALAAEARCDISSIQADDLPFSLSPRLNAAGRMGDVGVAFDLLMADDPAEAARLASELEAVNQERRRIEGELAEAALAQAEQTYDGERCVVVAGEGWHEGVKGIVASRLVSRFRVPALLFSIRDGLAVGSGRSAGAVDLFHAVEGCRDLLVRFGGHAGAVGVTLEASRLDEFRRRLDHELGLQPAQSFESREEVACLADLQELTMEAISGLDCLRPFGQGNRVPLMAVRGVTMRSRSLVGAGSDHLRFYATDGVSSVPAIMFRVPDPAKAEAYEGVVDLVFEPVVETWMGRSKAKLMVRDIIYREPHEPPAEPGLVDELFELAPQILSRDSYAGVAEEQAFFTKAVGVTHEGRQAVVAALQPGERLELRREPQNPYDSSAIALVRADGAQAGYLRRQIAAALAPLLDQGAPYEALVQEVTGGGDRSWGVNLQVRRLDLPEAPAPQVLPAAGEKDPAALTDALRQAMIGDHALLPAQARSLEALAAGESALCVMATGRGKSLIFHIHAAREALLHGRASIFVYPLRALVNDQSFHLQQALAPFGVTVRTLTGETPQQERDEVYQGLRDGSVQVVLTTPEYLAIHSQELAASGRVGFVVVDEAHHAGTSKGGSRAAYQEMPRVLQELGQPRVLAVTATASDSVARETCRLLGIQRVIKDVSVRQNLCVEDHREARDRESLVAHVVSSGEKCVVYVNSREQSVSLARQLRQRVPELGHRIAFYNAGMTREQRARVEEAFRDGRLTCIVSTSAFGEGVNLPDIRHVLLYHMPFGPVEFNQMSGRAGRDGQPAWIHVLFGRGDARINERILASGAPGREELVAVYRALRGFEAAARQQGDGSFSASNQDIAMAAAACDPTHPVDDRSVSCGVSVFKELGFLRTSGHGTARVIAMEERPGRMELTQSVRYQEGQHARESFQQFCDWVAGTTSQALLERVTRPIAPTFGEEC